MSLYSDLAGVNNVHFKISQSSMYLYRYILQNLLKHLPSPRSQLRQFTRSTISHVPFSRSSTLLMSVRNGAIPWWCTDQVLGIWTHMAVEIYRKKKEVTFQKVHVPQHASVQPPREDLVRLQNISLAAMSLW